MDIIRAAKHQGEAYADAVKRFADNALAHGRERFGQTPLFCDGLHVSSLEPVRWKSLGESWVVCNPANQQIWFRTLAGLSRLTGDAAYESAAKEATEFAFANLRYGGLFSWGGHMAFDLLGRRPVHASDKGAVHELKCHYPYYELMQEVNPAETRRYIEALWEAHILDWSRLEFSRHGKPGKVETGGGIWDRSYTGGEVFFKGTGLTFINAGSDLFYAAAELYRFSGDERPLAWAKRLARRYMETRHPDTGMGGYQFSISILPGVNGRGDRAVEQFGEQLKEHRPLEATLSTTRQIFTIAGTAGLCRMALGEALGTAGREFAEWAISDLTAYGEYAYDAQHNVFHPTLTDGTRLTGIRMEKDGYYGKSGDVFQAAPAGMTMLRAYSMGYRLSGDDRLWRIARSIAAGAGFGDIGESAASVPLLPSEADSSDPEAIFALLELYKATRRREYLRLAEAVGDRILQERFHHGFFLADARRLYAKLDALEPLALLHLAAALRDGPEMPVYCGGSPFFAAAYDGLGHQTDNSLIYSATEELR